MNFRHLDNFVVAASHDHHPLRISPVLVVDGADGGDGFFREFAVVRKAFKPADLFADDFHAGIFDQINARDIRAFGCAGKMLVGLRKENRDQVLLFVR